jgi:hypothetical protein
MILEGADSMMLGPLLWRYVASTDIQRRVLELRSQGYTVDLLSTQEAQMIEPALSPAIGWDSDARVSWDPRRGLCTPFCGPPRASSLKIVGDNAEGARRLAVVALPTPEARTAHGAVHLAGDPGRMPSVRHRHRAKQKIRGTRTRTCPPIVLH